MSGAERTICCCGASTWCKVIAWIQIVLNGLLLALAILGFVGVGELSEYDDDGDKVNKGLLYAAFAIALVLALLGFIMGIILLKGTNQKRVSYLKAWLIYGIISLVFSVITLIMNIVGGITAASIVSSVIGLGITAFTIAIVILHKREIEAGVFGPGAPTYQ